MEISSNQLNQLDLDELSRRELLTLTEALIFELEKTRSDLSESVRSEIDLKFSIEALIKKHNESLQNKEL